MALKLIAFAALVAAANAGVISAPAVLAPGAPLGPGGYAGPGAAAGAFGAGAGALAAHALGAGAFAANALSGAAFAAPALAARAHAAPALAVGAIGHAAAAGEYDPNPQYTFAYDVQDALTGDSKNQHESRSGDVVQGSYSVADPDGTRRTVEYTADPVNGFNAVVHKQPLVGKAVVAAAPALAKVAAPLGFAGAGGFGVGAGFGKLGHLGYHG